MLIQLLPRPCSLTSVTRTRSRCKSQRSEYHMYYSLSSLNLFDLTALVICYIRNIQQVSALARLACCLVCDGQHGDAGHLSTHCHHFLFVEWCWHWFPRASGTGMKSGPKKRRTDLCSLQCVCRVSALVDGVHRRSGTCNFNPWCILFETLFEAHLESNACHWVWQLCG